MPRKDFYHETVRRALEKDGWRITADPLILKYKEITLFADLSAERVFHARQGDNQIVVEVKSFGEEILMSEFERAVGQYGIYRIFLRKIGVEQPIYLAVSQLSYNEFFKQEAIREVLHELQINLVIFDATAERIIQWRNWQNIEK